MVHIRGHITEAEYEWLMRTLKTEFLEMDKAQGILNKISTNKEVQNGSLGTSYKCPQMGRA